MADKREPIVLKKHIRRILGGAIKECRYGRDGYVSSNLDGTVSRSGDFKLNTSEGYIEGHIIVKVDRSTAE